MPEAIPKNSLVAFKSYFEKRQSSLQSVMPKGLPINAGRVVKIVLASASRNPKLLDCTLESTYNACHSAVQLGLEPNSPLGHAYLVPFYNGQAKCLECTLIVGYKGLVDLARRSGNIETIFAYTVHKGDQTEIELGLEPKLKHVPNLTTERDPQTMTLVYAVAHLKGGGRQFVVMTRAEVDAIRSRSKSKETFSPWNTDYCEMAKKTAVKRLCKMLPLSIEVAGAFDENDEGIVDEDLKPVDGADVTPPPAAPNPKGVEGLKAAIDAKQPTAVTPDELKELNAAMEAKRPKSEPQPQKQPETATAPPAPESVATPPVATPPAADQAPVSEPEPENAGGEDMNLDIPDESEQATTKRAVTIKGCGVNPNKTEGQPKFAVDDTEKNRYFLDDSDMIYKVRNLKGKGAVITFGAGNILLSIEPAVATEGSVGTLPPAPADKQNPPAPTQAPQELPSTSHGAPDPAPAPDAAPSEPPQHLEKTIAVAGVSQGSDKGGNMCYRVVDSEKTAYLTTNSKLAAAVQAKTGSQIGIKYSVIDGQSWLTCLSEKAAPAGEATPKKTRKKAEPKTEAAPTAESTPVVNPAPAAEPAKPAEATPAKTPEAPASPAPAAEKQPEITDDVITVDGKIVKVPDRNGTPVWWIRDTHANKYITPNTDLAKIAQGLRDKPAKAAIRYYEKDGDLHLVDVREHVEAPPADGESL